MSLSPTQQIEFFASQIADQIISVAIVTNPAKGRAHADWHLVVNRAKQLEGVEESARGRLIIRAKNAGFV